MIDITVMIPLTQGQFAKVDMQDYHLTQYAWHISDGYAKRRVDYKLVPMQNVILQYHGPDRVDHIDRDRLNNRRSNLRILRHGLNIMNQGAMRVHSYMRADGTVMWVAKICVNRIQYQLGTARSRWAMEWLASINEQRALRGEPLVMIKRKNRWTPRERVYVDPYA